MATELSGREHNNPDQSTGRIKWWGWLLILLTIQTIVNMSLDDTDNEPAHLPTYGICRANDQGNVSFTPTVDAATAHEYNQSLNAMGVVSTVCTYDTYKESINNE